jgi:hypothetical protein
LEFFLLESVLFSLQSGLDALLVSLLSSFSFSVAGFDSLDYFDFVVKVGVSGELGVLVLEVAGRLFKAGRAGLSVAL